MNPLRWRSLLALCVMLGVVWILADGFVIAIPTIGRDLGASTDQLAWALSGFALGACFSALYGRLGDQHGNRLLVICGCVLFLAGTVAGALAGSAGVLIGARVVEGAGGYAVFTCSLSLITLEFPLEERAKALSIRAGIAWAASGTAVFVLAIVLAALGWRWIFWLAVPAMLVGLVLTLWTTPELHEGKPGAPTDTFAALTLATAFTVLTFALISADDIGPGPVAALVVAFFGLIGVFVAIERRSANPLIPLEVWRHPTFTGSIAANFVISAVLVGLFYALALSLQTIRGLTALQASFVLLGGTLPIIALNFLGTRLAERGRYRTPVVAGMAFLALGCFVIVFGERYHGTAVIFAGLVMIGCSIGVQVTPLSTMQVSSTESTKGVATGVVGIMYGVSVALGTAVATAIIEIVGRYETSQPSAQATLGGASSDKVLGVFSGSVPLNSFSSEAATTITHAFEKGVAACALVFGLMALAGLVVAMTTLKDVEIEE